MLQNQNLGLVDDHDLIRGEGHNLGLGQTHEHDDLGLVQAHDHKSVLGQPTEAHDHEMAPQNTHVPSDEQQNRLEQTDSNGINPGKINDPAIDEDDTAPENHELGVLENNELTAIENHDMDENLDHNQELSIVASPDMSIQQSHYEITPIRQSRSVALAPTHELTVGQEFPDVKSCRRALRDMAIALHFEIQTVKSDKTRFTAKCASEGCPWRIHAAKLPGIPSFTIRTIHEQHSCGGITHLGHQQASLKKAS